MIKTVSIDSLSPGMMVTAVLDQNGPVKIRKIGMIRSFDMIKGLKEMGVKTVEVDFSQSLETDISTTDFVSTSNNKTVEQESQIEDGSSATKKLITSKQHQFRNEQYSATHQHRTLFVPAMEETRLKSGLYANPKLTVFGLAIIGALLGSSGSFAFFEYSKYRNTIAIQQNAGNEPSLLGNKPVPAVEVNTSTNSSDNPATEQPDIANNMGNSVQETTSQQVAVTPKNSNLVSNERSELNSTDVMSVDVSPQTQNDQRTDSDLTLEDGQLILGYNPNQETENQTSENIESERPLSRPALNANDVNSSAQDSDPPINQDLLQRIKDAAQAVDSRPDDFNDVLNVTDLTALPRIDQLPQNLLAQMPSMSFSAHMYASNPQDRWVRVNSRRVGEGEFISNNLMLKKIEAEQVILDFRGTEFTMNALSDW